MIKLYNLTNNDIKLYNYLSLENASENPIHRGLLRDDAKPYLIIPKSGIVYDVNIRKDEISKTKHARFQIIPYNIENLLKRAPCETLQPEEEGCIEVELIVNELYGRILKSYYVWQPLPLLYPSLPCCDENNEFKGWLGLRRID